MKHLVLFTLGLLLFSACQDEAGSTAVDNETAIVTPEATNDPVIGDVVSPQTQRVLEILTHDHWLIEVYAKIQDREAGKANRGRWWKFDPNGTFQSGQWTKTTGSGQWTFDPQTLILHLDNTNDEEDAEFTLKISNDGSVMIWIGTERYNQSMIQAKMGNYIQLPESLPEPGGAQ